MTVTTHNPYAAVVIAKHLYPTPPTDRTPSPPANRAKPLCRIQCNTDRRAKRDDYAVVPIRRFLEDEQLPVSVLDACISEAFNACEIPSDEGSINKRVTLVARKPWHIVMPAPTAAYILKKVSNADSVDRTASHWWAMKNIVRIGN